MCNILLHIPYDLEIPFWKFPLAYRNTWTHAYGHMYSIVYDSETLNSLNIQQQRTASSSVYQLPNNAENLINKAIDKSMTSKAKKAVVSKKVPKDTKDHRKMF